MSGPVYIKGNRITTNAPNTVKGLTDREVTDHMADMEDADH